MLVTPKSTQDIKFGLQVYASGALVQCPKKVQRTGAIVKMIISEITEGTRCWKGYPRKGFKTHVW